MEKSGAGKSSERRKAVPVLFVRGSHYEVGYDVGRTFGAVIQSFIGANDRLRQFELEAQTPRGAEAYETTLSAMRKRFPHYLSEMEGIAAGAGVPFDQLFLLHMDDIIETINEVKVVRNDTGGCSSLAFIGPKEMMLGHTEDAFAETLNHFYIVSAHVIPTPEHRKLGAVEERFSSLCYAGQLPGYTMGFNTHGLVFSINTLSPMQLKPGHTPRTFITRAMLGARDADSLLTILRDEGLGIANGFSLNMLWSQPEKQERTVTNVEVAPDPDGDQSIINVQPYQEGEGLVHCNRYQRLNIKEVIGPIIDSSLARLAVLGNGAVSRSQITKLLSDTSGEVYRVFQDRPDAIVKTIAAGIFDLEAGTWSLYIDKPQYSEPVAVLPLNISPRK